MCLYNWNTKPCFCSLPYRASSYFSPARQAQHISFSSNQHSLLCHVLSNLFFIKLIILLICDPVLIVSLFVAQLAIPFLPLSSQMFF